MNVNILTILEVKPMEQTDLERMTKIQNAKYDKEMSVDEYVKMEKGFNPMFGQFKLGCEQDVAYFYQLTDAIYAVEHNMGDINEAGVYNYAIIRTVNEGSVYTNIDPKAFYLYEFNPQTKGYELVNKDTDIYKFLSKEFNADIIIEETKPNIVLNLTKEEATQNFATELKQSIENKDYQKIQQMVSQEDYKITNEINDVCGQVNDAFYEFEKVVNDFCDKLFGKFK